MSDINLTDLNNSIPFVPSSSAEITQDDVDVLLGFPFFWVQAFFDPSFAGFPQLVSWNNQYQSDSTTKVGSIIVFPFSGAMLPMKGQMILSSAVDRFGNEITSTEIGSSEPADQLSKVILYGGWQ